jgi:DNA-binding HxlR family transcriptional regulator
VPTTIANVDGISHRPGLLIIRDLLVGPRRYTDLKQGLPRIPTNILSARLKELEAAGVVERRLLPRPEGSVVYALTDYGRELETIVLAMGRWGAQRLDEPRDGEIVTTDSLVMALRSTFHPAAARGLRLTYELRVGDIVIGARVRNGKVVLQAGAFPDPNLVIETGLAVKAIMADEMTPGEALARGLARVIGDPTLLDTFVDLFHIDMPEPRAS